MALTSKKVRRGGNSKRASRKKVDPTIDIILGRQASIRRSALHAIARMQKLLQSTATCIEKSKVFPLYMVDVSDSIHAIELLEGQHTALENLRHHLVREHERRKNRGR